MQNIRRSSSPLTLGLIGFPLSRSLSPRLHTAAMKAMGIEGEYNLYPVQPDDSGFINLSMLVQKVREREIAGLNITIPHKQTVIPFLDEMTARAKAIGAVNTIWEESGKIIGDNTDAPGFLFDFYRLLRSQRKFEDHPDTNMVRKSVLVLGAGGAARAVIYALWTDGWDVTCAARRSEKSNQIISEYLKSRGNGLSCGGLLKCISLNQDSIQNYMLNEDTSTLAIVNASSAGMHPSIDLTPWPEGTAFSPAALVYDLVYKPSETRLMREARAAGLAVSNGLGMLIEQAALALETWTGDSVPRDAMYTAVRDQEF